MGQSRRVLVGVVGAAQGVKGEVRVKSYTGVPAAIGSYGPLSDESGRRSFTIAALRPVKHEMVVVRFEGLADRAAAAALTGTRLYVDRARLLPPDKDEFYQIDLIGLSAEDEDGRALGRVQSVENFGGGDILEIVPTSAGEPGEGRESLLVPFTRTFVPMLDFEAGKLVVARGALDLDAAPDDT